MINKEQLKVEISSGIILFLLDLRIDYEQSLYYGKTCHIKMKCVIQNEQDLIEIRKHLHQNTPLSFYIPKPIDILLINAYCNTTRTIKEPTYYIIEIFFIVEDIIFVPKDLCPNCKTYSISKEAIELEDLYYWKCEKCGEFIYEYKDKDKKKLFNYSFIFNSSES